MRQQIGSLGALPHSISLVLDKFFSENEIFIPTSDMYSVEVLLNAEHGTPTSGCYTVNVDALQIQGCSGRYCLIAYSNSMTRVWDLGNFRDWIDLEKKYSCFLVSWHAENKALYVCILETCSLKVNVFTSLGTLLLWKDDSGLAPVAKYLCSFRSASIMLIMSYFHRCKSEGLDTTKPLVSRSTFLVLTQLVFSVGLGE
ncbi:hypothetical protein KY289_017027 [Solanum tuberosum]|nr:hypothetical protein KY284_016818 [Solanum tuberosum]KAH0689669.1 hypothetical protein KY289_017027 [Solanum tuberosum]